MVYCKITFYISIIVSKQNSFSYPIYFRKMKLGIKFLYSVNLKFLSFKNKKSDLEKSLLLKIVKVLNAPGMIRTCDPMIRSHVLYPAELRVRKVNFKTTNLVCLCQASKQNSNLKLNRKLKLPGKITWASS